MKINYKIIENLTMRYQRFCEQLKRLPAPPCVLRYEWENKCLTWGVSGRMIFTRKERTGDGRYIERDYELGEENFVEEIEVLTKILPQAFEQWGKIVFPDLVCEVENSIEHNCKKVINIRKIRTK